MSAIYKLPFYFVLGASLSPAILATAGSYRPGNPYHSQPLQNAAICEQQCQLDTTCQGWNFIKINNRQVSGVCEFNSQPAAPIASPVSISGNGATSQSSSRLVSTGTRTTRVGMSDPVTYASTQTKSADPRASAYKTQRARTIPAKTIQTIGARPQLKHSLDALMPAQNRTVAPPVIAAAPTPQAPARITQPVQQQLPRLRHDLGTSSSPYPSQPKTSQTPDSIRHQPTYEDRPAVQNQAPLASPEPMPRRMAQNAPQSAPAFNAAQANYKTQPLAARPGPTLAPQPVSPQQQAEIRRNPVAVSAEAAQASLFGSLYDDVKRPRSLTPEDLADPDAPIATVSTVPIE